MRGNGSRRKWPYPSPALRPAPPSSAEGRRPTSRRPAGMPPTGMVNWYSWPWRSAPANASQGGSPLPLPLWPKQAIDRPTILARVTTFLMTSAPHNPPPPGSASPSPRAVSLWSADAHVRSPPLPCTAPIPDLVTRAPPRCQQPPPARFPARGPSPRLLSLSQRAFPVSERSFPVSRRAFPPLPQAFPVSEWRLLLI